MKHKLLFILAGIISAQTLMAQQSRTMTLREAIELTLAYSKTLQSDKTKIEAATLAVKEAYEKKLPEAGVTASYLYLPFQPNINLHTDSDTAAKKNNPI